MLCTAAQNSCSSFQLGSARCFSNLPVSFSSIQIRGCLPFQIKTSGTTLAPGRCVSQVTRYWPAVPPSFRSFDLIARATAVRRPPRTNEKGASFSKNGEPLKTMGNTQSGD
jgi:hypothetical protein